MALSTQDFEKLKAQLASRQQTLQSTTSSSQTPGFFSRVGTDITNRIKEVSDINKQTNPLDFGTRALNVVGKGIAGGINDVIGEGLNSIPGAKSAINTVATPILQNPNVQNIMTDYNSWKQQNPVAASRLESIGNIASLIPFGEGGIIGKNAVKTATGDVLKNAGVAIEKKAIPVAQDAKNNFIKELVRQPQTKSVIEDQVSRTTETGSGLSTKSIIQPSYAELAAERAVSTLPDISPTKTFQQNYNIIRDANVAEARALEQKINQTPFIVPKKEIISTLNKTSLGLADNPLIVGDASAMANKLIEGAKKIINQNKGTGEGLLNARKEFDQWVTNQKPKVFDAKSEGALTISVKAIRSAMTNMLDEKAPNIGVKESLRKQHALYNAMENIVPKAAQEADTAIGRLFDRVGVIMKTKSRVVQGTAMAVGLGGLGAASTFAPPVAGALGVYIMYRGGKYLLRPEVRVELGKFLQKYGEKLSPSDKKLLEKLVAGSAIGVLKNKIETTPNKQGGFARIPSIGSKIDDHIASYIDELIGEAEKINKSGKLNLDTLSDLENIKNKVTKGNLSSADRRAYNEAAAKLGREDLVMKPETGKGSPTVETKTLPVADPQKYKSTEEFVKAQPTLYRADRGTPKMIDKGGNLGEGIYFSNEKSVAVNYMKDVRGVSNPTVTEVVISPNAKMRKMTMADAENKYPNPQALKNETLKMGYDGIDTGANVVVFNKDVIQAKSQLTDIWNKANKK